MANERQLAPEHAVQQEAPGAATADSQPAVPTAAGQMSGTPGLWEKIQRHKVVEWTLAYVAAGFALVHAVEMGSHAFEWPRLVSKLTIVGWLAGIPVAATLAWYHGHRAQQRVSRAELSILILLLFLVGSVLWFFTRSGIERERPQVAVSQPISGNPANVAPAFAPPPHSLAVLPFVNMSGDPKQEYFSDGLSEELLDSLATIRDLRVAARTSSFTFKGKDADIADIAHRLNVGAVLEGSVRRDGNHVRITAQLIDAVTGFHLWSQTYDRDVKNVLSLQTEIATAVTRALQATLLADAAAVIEQGGTQNPQAFDAYLRGKDIFIRSGDKARLLASIAAFDEAIHLDHGFAKAYAAKAIAEEKLFDYYANDVREYLQQARAAAESALALAPELGAAHAAFARILSSGFYEFDRALAEFQRALALSPNDADVLMRAGQFFSSMGRADAGVTIARQGIALDQLNPESYRLLGSTLEWAHRYREAIEAYGRALALNQKNPMAAALRGRSLLRLGEFESARQSCATPPLEYMNRFCLAIAYDKLHRHPEAETEVSAMRADMGDALAYQYAQIYAQWGDVPKALDWIEKAYRLRDSGLAYLKADTFLDPLRNEPRFKEIERKLRFPG